MVDFKNVIRAVLFFLSGLFFMVVSYYILPILIDILEISATMTAVFWVGLVVIWILAVIVMPAAAIYKAFESEAQ